MKLVIILIAVLFILAVSAMGLFYLHVSLLDSLGIAGILALWLVPWGSLKTAWKMFRAD